MPTTSIILDQELIDYYKEKKINISEFCREAMQSKLNIDSGNLAGLELEQLKKEVEELEHEKLKIQINIKSKNDIIEHLLVNKVKEEKEKLEKQKEQAQKVNNCINCGGMLHEGQTHKFKTGLVCRHCYLSADSEQISKWNNGGNNE